MALQGLGLKGDPFAEVPDPKFTFQHEGFRRLSAELLFSRMSDRRGIAVVEGPEGVGKTTLLVHLAADPKLSSSTLTVAAHDRLKPVRFLEICCRALDLDDASLPNEADLNAWMETFAHAVVARKRREGSMLLLVDRAEHLSSECVDVVISLSEIRLGGRKLIHPILVLDSDDDGDPMPEAYAGQEAFIAFRYWLGPMQPQEVGPFIKHRLKQAGYDSDSLIEEDALNEIVSFSNCLPGRIIAICREVLAAINADLEKDVTPEGVARAARMLGYKSAGPDTSTVVPAPGSEPPPPGEGSPEGGAWDLSLDDLVPDFEDIVAGPKAGEELKGARDFGLPISRSAISRIVDGALERLPLTELLSTRRWRPAVITISVVLVCLVGLFFLGGRLLAPTTPDGMQASMQDAVLANLETQVSALSSRLNEVEIERDRLERSLSAYQIADDELKRAIAESNGSKSGRSGHVLEIQQILGSLGYDPGVADGEAGGKTREAIKRYQADHQLAVTGKPSQALLAHMVAFKRLKEAVLLYHDKDFAGAVTAYDAVLSVQPNDRETQLFRGLAELRQGNLAAGVADLKTAGVGEAGLGAARFTPARVYFIQERLKSLGFDPGRTDGRYDEGTARAIEAYQRIQGLPLNPEPSLDLLQHLEIYRFHAEAIAAYHRGEDEKAVEIYSLVLALAPDDAQAYFNRGLAHKRLGQLQSAREDYDNAIVLDPAMAKAYYDRGNIFMAEGRYLSALKDYARALRRWVGLS